MQFRILLSVAAAGLDFEWTWQTAVGQIRSDSATESEAVVLR